MKHCCRRFVQEQPLMFCDNPMSLRDDKKKPGEAKYFPRSNLREISRNNHLYRKHTLIFSLKARYTSNV